MPNNRGGIPMYNENPQYNATISSQLPQGSPASFGTQVAKEMAGMGDVINKWGTRLVDYSIKMQERDDNAFVLEKDNEMRQAMTELLYNPQNGLANTKGKNSFGVTQTYDEEVEKLTQNIMSGIGNPALKAKLQEHNMQWVNSLRTAIAKHEGGERFTFYSNQITGGKTNAVNIGAQIGGMPGMQASSSIIAGLKGQTMSLLGWDKTMADNWEKEANSEAFSLIADDYVQRGDMGGLQSLVDTYGDKVSANAFTKANTKLGVINQQQDAAKLAEQLIAEHPELIDEDGNFDKAKYDELVDILNGENAAGRVERVFVGGGSVNTIDGLMAAIGGQESSGDYEAQNGRTKAYGKYQIMPDNWPSWAEEAGLGANAAQTPENQEKVARYKLNQYLQQYGAEGAMVAWYSGPANAERWVNGETTDVYGRSWDAKNGNGDEPSIREYVQQVSSRGGTGGVSFDELNPDIDASGVNLAGTEPKTIGMINRADQIHFEMFGTHLWVSATTGGHKEGTPHALGKKADVGSDALRDSKENRIKFQQALQAEGIGANNEYDMPSEGSTGGHFDLDNRGKNWQTGEDFGGFNGTPGGHYIERQVSGYNPVMNSAMKAYGQRKADMIKGQNERQITTWVNALLENANVINARDQSEIDMEMDKMGIPRNKRAKVMNRVQYSMGVNNSHISRVRSDVNWNQQQMRISQAQAQDNVSAWILGKIQRGETFTSADIMDLPDFGNMDKSNALSMIQHMKSAEASNDPYAGWYKGDNQFAFEKAVSSMKKQNNLDDMYVPNIRSAITAANAERKKNGQPPMDSGEIEKFVAGQSMNWKVKGRLWGYNSSEQPRAALQPGQYVSEDGRTVYDAEGTPLVWDDDMKMYRRPN